MDDEIKDSDNNNNNNNMIFNFGEAVLWYSEGALCSFQKLGKVSGIGIDRETSFVSARFVSGHLQLHEDQLRFIGGDIFQKPYQLNIEEKWGGVYQILFVNALEGHRVTAMLQALLNKEREKQAAEEEEEFDKSTPVDENQQQQEEES
jgi:hypothetical protein